jgi:KipI family sensor histidine kinase inhibitor
VLAEAGVDIAGLRAAVAEITAGTERASTDPVESDEVLVRVRYDGPDLDDVAALTGLSRAEVIGRHSGTRWRAAFIGFAPGFAYLVGDDGRLDVPRRAESRTRVPAGAVALAGGYSAVYPRESPGGWQLIGSTDTILWAVDREPPSLIRPGSRVRFVDAEHD